MNGKGTVLAIDAGNTRIKWGLHDGAAWLAQGAVPKIEAVRLTEAWKGLPTPSRVAICNVAGELIKTELTVLTARWRVPVIWASSKRAETGVSDGYENPAQLGADRWVALIAARHLVAGAALVVMAGTALTVDALTSDGRFLGGLILPGPNAMAEVLTLRTAGVRVEHGHFELFPVNTRNAVWSAALQAACGAIERVYRALRATADCAAAGRAAAAAGGKCRA